MQPVSEFPEPEETDLSRLSREVLRGDPDSADIGQEAWLLLHRQANGRLRYPQAWLRIAIRHLSVRLRRRESGRRIREERAARPESVPSVLEQLEHEARRDYAWRLVGTLTEPYRQVVAMRYLEELEIDEMAARLGRSPGTVRSQLKRGLDRLRDRSGEERRAAWGLVPFLRWRSASARERSAALRSWGLAGAAAATLLGGLGWFAMRASTEDVAAASVAVLPSASSTELRNAARPRTPRERVPLDRAAGTAARSPFAMDAWGTVLDPEGRPVPEAALWVGDRDEPDGTLVGHADARGRYALSGLDGRKLLWAERDGQAGSDQHLIASRRPESSLDLTLGHPVGSLIGQVVAGDGGPLSGGSVTWIATEFEPLALKQGGQETLARPARPESVALQPDGSFRMTAPLQDTFRLLVTAEGQPPLLLPVQARTRPIELELTLPKPAVLEGRLVREDGRPVSGATLEVLLPEPLAPRRVTTDARGAFELANLPPVAYAVRVLECPDDPAASGYLSGTLAEGEQTTIELPLNAKTLLQGHATVGGLPAVGWIVELDPRGQHGFGLDLRRTRTDRDGRFRFLSCDPQSFYALRLFSPEQLEGPPCDVLTHLWAGAEEVVLQAEATGAPGALVGRFVVDPPGSLPSLMSLETAASAVPIAVAVDPGSGQFRADDLAPGKYRAMAFLPGLGTWEVGFFKVEPGPASETVIPVPRAGTLAIALLFEDGANLDDLRLYQRTPAFHERVAKNASHRIDERRIGDRVLIDLVPGTYDITAEVAGTRYQTLRVRVSPGQLTSESVHVGRVVPMTVEVLLERRLERREALMLRVRDASGARRVNLGYASRRSTVETFEIGLTSDTCELILHSRMGLVGRLTVAPEDLVSGGVLRIRLSEPSPR